MTMAMCVKEYHNILYGSVINVYTDHNHLIHRLLAHMAMCLKVLLEQYDIYLMYFQSKVKYWLLFFFQKSCYIFLNGRFS